MRTKLLAITALLCLFAAGAAYAAGPVTGGPNTYSGNFSVSGGAGTVAKPKVAAVTESLEMGSATAGNVGAPLTEIKTSTYGLKAPNANYFPKCTTAQISAGGNSGKWNGVCPKGSLVGSGSVLADLTNPTDNLSAANAIPCHLKLWVYNAGPGKLSYFFTTNPSVCDGLSTGAAAPWSGKVYSSGKNLITDVLEPADVSYNAGNLGLFGSLVTETLKYKNVTAKKGKKVYPFLESIGCSHGARPFTITYSATQSNSGSPSVGSGTVKGSAKC